MATPSVTIAEEPHNEPPKLNSIASHGVNGDFIRQAVDIADANILRICLYQLTKDPELAAMRVNQFEIRGGAVVDYVLSQEDQKTVRNKTLTYFLQGIQEIPPPPV